MAAIKTLCLTSLFLIVSRISALQIGNDSKTACESSDVTIGFNFTIGNDSFADRSWYKNSVIPANKIARVVGAAGSLTVESQYIGRIALSGSGGIILYNVTKTDSGSYLFIIVTGTYFEDGTATTTVNVYVNPNASCMPKIEKNSADNFYCKISDACPGKDSIQAIWDDGSVGAFTCSSTTKNNHKCCAKGDQVNYCNSIGDLCTVIECPGSDNSTSSTPTMTSGLTGGQIAGIVCGCIGFLIVCCLVGWRICKCTVMKDKTKNSGPPAVHTETQNKVDPNTRSKQTNDRQQPVPPANTGFKDTPTFRPLPTPPQNGEIKDRNVRGISATIGDTPDLSNETPRPKKLPPLTAKQEIVQEVDASEEPKRKRKKKKKKDQMNVETPEEENGETDMRVN